jgi:hypothetical protein
VSISPQKEAVAAGRHCSCALEFIPGERLQESQLRSDHRVLPSRLKGIELNMDKLDDIRTREDFIKFMAALRQDFLRNPDNWTIKISTNILMLYQLGFLTWMDTIRGKASRLLCRRAGKIWRK